MAQPSWQKIEQSLMPLCIQGLFPRIFGWNDPTTLIVDCALYFTDTDEHGNPASLFTVESVDKMHTARHTNHRCICCYQLPQDTVGSNPMPYKHGSIICPICSASTKPGTLRQRSFRGLFHFAVGESPSFLGPAGGEKDLPQKMTNEEQIEAITEALSRANTA
jgi:hypothetical protein